MKENLKQPTYLYMSQAHEPNTIKSTMKNSTSSRAVDSITKLFARRLISLISIPAW